MRRVVAGAIVAAVVVLFPLVFSAGHGVLSRTRVFEATLIFLYAIAALSMHQLIGYAGQISLGHQAFIGVGAFTTANLVSRGDLSFWLGVAAAAAVGGLAGAILGLTSLRLSGLYFALATLAYGFAAEHTLFLVPELTRGGAGMPAPRPAGFGSDRAYFYLCAAGFGVLLAADHWFVKTRPGRAVLAIRDDERVAAANGIAVHRFKLLVFAMAGAYAGIAGGLFAHWRTQVVAGDFGFNLALTFVLIVVVGGIGSRAGIFIASGVFAMLPLVVPSRFATWVPVAGAALLLLTLIFHPGGIGDQLKPLSRRLAGGRA